MPLTDSCQHYPLIAFECATIVTPLETTFKAVWHAYINRFIVLRYMFALDPISLVGIASACISSREGQLTWNHNSYFLSKPANT